LRAGRKISAIRLYQERTGVSLREARQAIEQLERESSH
jgi:ribosomal protein L7/L12